MPSRIQEVAVVGSCLIVGMVDKRSLVVPLANHPSLLKATQEQRENFKIVGIGEGIHWPDLDEDLSLKGLMSMEY